MKIFSASDMGPRVRAKPVGPSRTKQSFRAESEIENIMARYVKTGIIDHLSRFGAEYGFASSVSFHEAMNVVSKAEQMFDALPAAVRQRFSSDPGEFLEFVQNPENQEEMIKLGLAERKAEVAREPVVAGPVAESAPIAPEVVLGVVDTPGSAEEPAEAP